jgi:hypothetical protein
VGPIRNPDRRQVAIAVAPRQLPSLHAHGYPRLAVVLMRLSGDKSIAELVCAPATEARQRQPRAMTGPLAV